MNLFKLKKTKSIFTPNSNFTVISDKSAKSRLTENQEKTVALLRKIAKKKKSKRYRRVISEYKDKSLSKESKLGLPSTISNSKIKIKATIPLRISSEAKAKLKSLKRQKDVKKIIFSQDAIANPIMNAVKKGNKEIQERAIGVNKTVDFHKTPFENLGLLLEVKEKKLNLKISYPTAPSMLRSQSLNNQGDIQYKIDTAFGNRGVDKQMSNECETENTDSLRGKDSSGELDKLINDIIQPNQEGSKDILSETKLDNVAWHDFSQYLYVREPIYERAMFEPSFTIIDQDIDTSESLEASNVGEEDYVYFKGQVNVAIRRGLDLAYSDEYSTAIATAVAEFHRLSAELVFAGTSWQNYVDSLPSWVASPPKPDELLALEQEVQDASSEYQAVADIGNTIFETIMKAWQEELQADIAEIFFQLNTLFSSHFLLRLEKLVENFAQEKKYFTFAQLANDNVSDIHLRAFWQEIVNILKAEFIVLDVSDDESNEPTEMEEDIEQYSFNAYWPNSFNLGLRLVYRQEWRTLGNQRGEIVRTIPLGPKQMQKVSTKILRRTKVSKNSENLKSTETTTETSDAAKDSEEIVREASNTFNWHAEAEASANWGWGSAKISAGMENESTEKSKETGSHLSETMQKTASKIRTETKVVVSTESEETFESSTASEISNPNDEIPITYVFSKLQRQYDIFTSLAEVNNVIMIAERLPKPGEINFDWVKKHDWIIAKVLLDDSFRDALTSISQGISPQGPHGMQTAIEGSLESTLNSLASLATANTQLNVSGVDIVQESQKGYREIMKEKAERLRQKRLIIEKRKRFYGHIRDNILHYCRAIWSQEDPQKRQLRYRKLNLKIPVEWGTESSLDLDQQLKDIEEYERTRGPADPDFPIDVEFVSRPDSEKDVADIINPAGPIGYQGNYAIYYIKPEYAGSGLFAMLDILKVPYYYYPEKDAGDTTDPEPTLMDPLLKRITLEKKDVGPDPDDMKTKKDMVEYVPDLRLLYAIAKKEGTEKEFFGHTALEGGEEERKKKEEIEKKADELFKKYYADYLFRKEQSRRFLLETNNTMIDIQAGKGTALEGFKLAHRGIDASTANEKKKKVKIENKRRKKLIKNGNFGDPDIERLVIVTGDKTHISDIVAGTETSGKGNG